MAKSSSSRSNGRSSIFTGLLIGLIVGVILAVGVALWVTGNNPFKDFVAPDTAPVSAPAQPVPPATPDTAPSFDFYKVLPGDAPNELPANAPTSATPAYYLQAGAFQSAEDADNLKAQLALLGLEAVILTSDVPEKGVLHRVRVGPLHAMDTVNQTRSLLTQNNIPATLVRDEPNPQETP
ncbi:MAG: SPOR domain-containing protein [Thiobacillus sp.]